MEQKPAPRKMKFAPRAPPKRVPKPEVKSEPVETDNNSQAADLLRRINEGALRRPKTEKKVPASQIAWMGGVVNSTRSHGYPNGDGSSRAGVYGSGSTQEIEYEEPWDYDSYYPVTLPIRPPYSGNPETLDEEEFAPASQAATHHENSINAAAELGLMARDETVEEPKMLFMQLPTAPMFKQLSTSEQNENKPDMEAGAKEKACGLKELPKGFMGKMIVYKSGAVKLKLGDVLYDVNPGLKCEFAQDVMAINSAEKQCCLIEKVHKHAVLTPDIDYMLNNLDGI
ncbi:PREDICTED: uncharacterized protein LOC104808893 [Tarenaya hassleriana]|uniref:uncharacterized protein LOC104808893 n=1 Tax=Tarenaya hassleriana TaxID=28532 RepID=UPI00053C59AE|nr:PREDICTED: uncharacterized protein LOC104808893 [Tarenaya hassleriana]XP_010533038.1 PREDICTED: uncharacterized protein LOC104808893 [Tarenaya hassleriana]